MRKTFITMAAAVFTTLLGACSQMQIAGGGQSPDSTAVAGTHAPTADNMHRCAAPLGTIAIEEDTGASWYSLLTGQYHLGSTVPVLKMLVQESNCFVIVDRGRALNQAMEERALGEAGELRASNRIRKGKMVVANYTMTPSITFSDQNAGSIAGVLAVIPVVGVYAAQVAGQINTKSASTTLTLVDNRSTVQIAAATGSARSMDVGAIAGLTSSRTVGTVGGYSDTPEGKVIIAAFTDSLNNLIDSVKQYKGQHVKGGLGTVGQLRVD
ncbi:MULTISPECIES: CsgG/HfaB family protein [Pandoraea]|uniref:Peptidoglycan-binding protein n=2 Tax=Pandoraea TaxID=93217 RepID=A0A5E4XIY5_9BURK|nr:MULTISPECIES: CsgG/HfaB family protein [Pandoraea]VVE18282.1 peptidoglycan-binding protein [Pandoraea cepalis]VVE36115.1 peptidoglycan-binding protein [Pandoraea terrigena]